MATEKVAVEDLERGMYVSELDRPWVGSPFLFQGFIIETHEEIEQLKQTCKFVYIDESRSANADRTIRRSLNVRPEAEERMSRTHWNKLSEEERKLTYKEEIQKAVEQRAKTRTYIDNLFTDIRLGDAIDTDTAKEVVVEMVDNITEDATTALWLTNLKEAHDYTAQHCINVSVLAIVFARHLGFTKEQMKLIGLGALLHDVGKMKTPPEILDKPGKLTTGEFEIIKRHPVDGHEIMEATGEIPKQALQIIRYHHERLSGRGYPDGLKGDQISTAVLMVAISDIYDAMTSERVYHHAMPSFDALNILHKVAPGEFGKELMEEFIRCIGIYPVGSVVELTGGDVGVVMSVDPDNKLRPLVMLVRDRNNKEYLPRRFVSLTAMSQKGKGEDWSVRRIVNPMALGLSLRQIAEEELFHGGSEVIHL